MKYAAAVLILACSAAGATPPVPKGADLRSLLTQVKQGTVPAPERQLSAAQRAELRRQLAESRAARRKP